MKILDFGLAKLTRAEGGPGHQPPDRDAGHRARRRHGHASATCRPSRCAAEPADARSDIFSFGAILYEMLSGPARVSRRLGGRHDVGDPQGRPAGPLRHDQSISPALERIVRHCLEKNPEQRFHSAHDVAFDLEAVSGVSAAGRATRRRTRDAALDLEMGARRGRGGGVIGLALLLVGRLGSP